MLASVAETARASSWPMPLLGGPTPFAPIDSNGNLTSKTEGSDNWAYTWNAENQLTKVEKNGAEVARYAYDPGGRRVEKVAGGVTTTYAYDVMHIARETSSAGAALSYVHGPDIDEWLGRQSGDGPMTYFVADALGTVVAETNAAGAVTLTRAYDAWGSLDATSAALGGPSYTGRWWEPEAHIYDYRARWLDPRLGRFISEDPIRFLSGDPNFYVYVRSRPTVAVDPTGLLLDTGTAVGAGVGAATGAGAAAGAVAGGLITANVVIWTFDIIEAHKLCVAYEVCKPPKPKCDDTKRLIRCRLVPQRSSPGWCVYECPGQGNYTIKQTPRTPGKTCDPFHWHEVP